MRKTALFLVVLILISSLPVSAARVAHVQAPSYYLATLDTGAVLVEENCSAALTPGDFSKIMTALIASEKLKEKDVIEFKKEDMVFTNSYGSIAPLKAGDSLTFKEHLYNMLLLYSDASANAVARQISGSCEKFTEEMNKRAEKLGLKNTFFTSPSGSDPSGKSKISVKDLAALAKTAYENDFLADIFSTVEFELNGKRHTSRNHLLSKYTYSDFTYSAATGMMVCQRKDSCDLVATASRGSASLLAIVIGSPKSDLGRHFLDSINLFEHGFNNFTVRTVCRENTILGQVEVSSGAEDSVTLEAAENCTAYTPISYNESLLSYEVVTDEKVTAPVKKGEVLGKAIYYYEGSEIAQVPVVASENVSFGLVSPILGKLNTKLLFFVVVAILVLILLRYNAAKKKEERRKKREQIKKNMD